MLNRHKLLNRFFQFLLLVSTVTSGTIVLAKTTEEQPSKIETIEWENLVPDGYDAKERINGFLEQLEGLRDSDPEAMMIYGNIEAELDSAPVNTSLDGKMIKMPGFIAPLDVDKDVVTEFLLVPYYGACIHLPPPPMNQTVLIKADKGQGIKFKDVDLPVWVTGKLRAVEERTDIGAAGYRIESAKIEIYKEDK